MTIDKEAFWIDAGITEEEQDNTTVVFTDNVEEQVAPPPEVEDVEEDTPPPPAVDPVLEKLNALEERYASLQSALEQGRQPVQPQPVQPAPQPQQQFQYQPTRYLNDADLVQYHMQQQEMHRQNAQLMHQIRVDHERQRLQEAKQHLETIKPDIFKYVDPDKVDAAFEDRVSKGQFGFDWKQGIDAIYKLSKFQDLEKQASELEQARQVKQAKQAKALKAVNPGGASYQPATTQPVAGNGRGFKAASAGFLADFGLG